jgi:flagellar basal-body rod protein FlgB
MDNSTINALTSALDFGSTRLQALSNNLSNVSTPGYKREDVSFQALLASANSDSSGDDTELTTGRLTDPRHISFDDGEARPNPAIVTEGGDSMRADGNNVDVDAEGARLAAAQIYYSGAAQMLQGQFTNLKFVIAGGK